jgi:DNA repair protein RadC
MGDNQINRTSIKTWSNQDMPREKMAERGASSLTDAELLAILIRTGLPGQSALDIAKDLLNHVNNDLSLLSRLTYQEMQKNFKGLGDAKAITIVAALELGRRRRENVPSAPVAMNCSRAIYDYIMPRIVDNRQEEFWAILTNRKFGVIHAKPLFKGGLDSVIVDVKVVLKYALDFNAAGICVVHNHPSGYLNPSQLDINLTKKLEASCDVIGLQFIDHIIVADNYRYYSFLDKGLINLS